MRETVGDLWDYHKRNKAWVVVTTNLDVKKDGTAVMGRGVAKQAAERFGDLPRLIGEANPAGGMIASEDHRIISFPVKYHWREKADLNLVEESARKLAMLGKQLEDSLGVEQIYLPRPGCGNGQLDWEDVKPILETQLWEDRFIVVAPSNHVLEREAN